MSDLFGFAYRDEHRPAHSQDVLPMIHGLPGNYGKRVGPAVVGPIGIALLRGEPTFAGIAEQSVGSGRSLLGFAGTVYNIADVVGNGESSAQSRIDRLLEMFVESGVSVVSRIRGEFVLAYWDGRDEALYLATDRFRSQPLFYSESSHGLVFGSRLKAVLASSLSGDFSIDPSAIVDLMAFSAVATPRTIFREVKKIPPGHLLSWKKGQIVLRPYWDIDFSRPSGESRARLKDLIKVSFAEALQVRIRHDQGQGTIGTFLSGGIDSSTVTGVLTQLTKGRIKAFTIGFEEPGYNELDFAENSARYFNAEHFTKNVTVEDVHQALPMLVQAFDEPFANASAIPTYFCAKLAKDHGVDILYAGDGGDELFGGNERYGTQKLFDYYGVIPRWLRIGCVEPLVHALADIMPWSLPLLAKKYIARANVPYPDRLTSWGLFSSLPLSELGTNELSAAFGLNANPYAPIAFHYKNAIADTELDRQLYIDLKLIISDNDLIKVNRAAEAAGVAVRFPFLDHQFVECAARVPAEMKMRGHHLRTFFKEAYADLLPSATRTKTKHGFGLPIALWLRSNSQLRDMMYDLVLSSNSVQRGYFKRNTLERLIEEHKIETGSFYGTVVWNIMMIEMWHRTICPNAKLIKGST